MRALAYAEMRALAFSAGFLLSAFGGAGTENRSFSSSKNDDGFRSAVAIVLQIENSVHISNQAVINAAITIHQTCTELDNILHCYKSWAWLLSFLCGSLPPFHVQVK